MSHSLHLVLVLSHPSLISTCALCGIVFVGLYDRREDDVPKRRTPALLQKKLKYSFRLQMIFRGWTLFQTFCEGPELL